MSFTIENKIFIHKFNCGKLRIISKKLILVRFMQALVIGNKKVQMFTTFESNQEDNLTKGVFSV